ncbi:hypothetical protein ACFYXM_02380 [Streptomyces sp. NPDC002476]|uniref:hypothetical protein n=1 Tax=Streptomyces sp. NPDC002476 TaxID=3364648 RepID=UPI0036B7638B
MTDHGQQFGREESRRYGRGTREPRERELASPGGPLPGAVLDVPELRDGGAGHVQPGAGRPVGDTPDAAEAPDGADAIGLRRSGGSSGGRD